MKPCTTRRCLRGLIISGVALATLAVETPARASQYLEASRPGVYGNADVDYESAERAYPIRMYVEDTSCNSNDVYVRFIVYTPGGTWKTQKRRNSNGCGTSVVEWNNLYIHDYNGIWAVQLEACEDNAGGDDCALSATANNPYLPPPDAQIRIMIAAVQIAGSENLPGPNGITNYEGQL